MRIISGGGGGRGRRVGLGLEGAGSHDAALALQAHLCVEAGRAHRADHALASVARQHLPRAD
eukprot:2511021-Rhodomonas_salina.1